MGKKAGQRLKETCSMKTYTIASCVLLTMAGMVACGMRHHTDRHEAGNVTQATDSAPRQGYYGTIRFYEGYNGSEDTFCAESITQRPLFKQKKMGDCGKNDEAKSMKFEGTPAGTVVKVYDNPNCDTGDDYAVITTLRDAMPNAITVWNFEDNDSDDPTGYHIRYYWEDGNLDGKVSCVQIIVPAAP